ncbi:MAG: EAL domain-containing protein [Cyanobacteriota bacterium]|nr:EAL domain-containing protein [Cyanobacteriota bacterium]
MELVKSSSPPPFQEAAPLTPELLGQIVEKITDGIFLITLHVTDRQPVGEFWIAVQNTATCHCLGIPDSPPQQGWLSDLWPSDCVETLRPLFWQCWHDPQPLTASLLLSTSALPIRLLPMDIPQGRYILGILPISVSPEAPAASTFLTAELDRQVRVRTAQLNKQLRSLKLQNEILERLDNAVIVTNETGEITFCNGYAQTLCGLMRDEVLGEPLMDLLPFTPDQRQAIGRALQQRQPWSDQVQFPQAEGSRTIWLTLSTIQDHEEWLGSAWVGTDISQLQQIQQTLRNSESHFRALFERAAIGIKVTNLKGEVVDCNPAMLAMLGYSGGELQTQPFARFTHPEDLPQELALYEELASGQRHSYQLEKRFLRRDGQIFWGRLTVSLVRDSQNQPLFSFGMVEDITERQQALEALQGSQQMLRLVMDNIPQAIFWKDRHLVYVGCNQVAAQDMGLPSPAHVVGKTDLDLGWLPHQQEAFRDYDQQVLASQQPISYDLWEMVMADGNRAWVSINKVPLWNAAGEVVGVLGTYRDITRRVQVEEALRQAEAKYRSIFENAVEGIFQSNIHGQLLTANPMLAKILGYDSPEALMQSVPTSQQLYVDPQRWQTFTQRIRAEGMVMGFESEVYHRAGHKIWISECARPVHDPSGAMIGFEGTVEDISKRKQSEVELRQRDSLLQGAAEATHVLLTCRDLPTAMQQVLEIVGQAAAMDRVALYQLQEDPSRLSPLCHRRYLWTAQPEEEGSHRLLDFPILPLFADWYTTLGSGSPITATLEHLPPEQQVIFHPRAYGSVLISPILVASQLWGFISCLACQANRLCFKGEESVLTALAGSLGSAIERQQSQDQMYYQARRDPLTTLPNRLWFAEKLRKALAEAEQHHRQMAVLFLDLDRFKMVNDSLGHTVGDSLLIEMARRLGQCLSPHDTVARWGGDEFTVLLTQVPSPEAVSKAAETILQSLKPPTLIDGHELFVTGSIGIALYPQDGDQAETLIKHADAALYRAKDQNRSHFQFYTSDFSSQASELLSLGNSLHRALERQEFVVYFQPLVNLQSGRITCLEALVRWQHPELGLVPPGRFIPLAEDNGLIIPLGELVLRQACQQVVAWHEVGFGSLGIAVNLSVRQFQQPQLVNNIQQILIETGLPSHHLELEVTESLAMQDASQTIRWLQELKAMGTQIAIDDFGTGYSSLNYLKQFPIDTLKIDRSFVHSLARDTRDMAIVSTVIALGNGLGLKVIAEGVETQEQYELLRQLDCDEIQGYWFSRPLPAPEVGELLRHNQQSPLLPPRYA